jgi:hypothetical protein
MAANASRNMLNDGLAYTPTANHTPHDTTEIDCNAFSPVDADGDVAVITAAGVTVTLYCLKGIIYPVRCKIIKNTGTTATNVALFD